MKKVVYSVTKVGRNENTKMTGLGYITDKDLIILFVFGVRKAKSNA